MVMNEIKKGYTKENIKHICNFQNNNESKIGMLYCASNTCNVRFYGQFLYIISYV